MLNTMPITISASFRSFQKKMADNPMKISRNSTKAISLSFGSAMFHLPSAKTIQLKSQIYEKTISYLKHHKLQTSLMILAALSPICHN